MHEHDPNADIPVVRDADDERPIPSAWRPVLADIVGAFASHDYRLERGIPGVAPVSDATATQIREAIEDYGDALTALPDAAWETSVCIWTGDHWDVLVDLWTEDEGASDLALQVRVVGSDGEYVFDVHMVFVP